ncbi:MAG: hypothetical protein JNK12_06535 [Acidimicrobiales bacterium]|nr:hypothetical protein [Acidimicrobiales bacterium]
MVWLAVPLVLIVGSLAALVAIGSLESARRELQVQRAALAEARAAIGPVQGRIDAVRAAAARPTRR